MSFDELDAYDSSLELADIFIKDEGYASVRLHTAPVEVKEWCHNHGLENSLTSFGKTWCGDPVWYPGMKEGRYSFALKVKYVHKFIAEVKKAGFTVESEF